MTETAAPRRTPQSVVHSRITALQHGYLANRSGSVAALARLRRSAGKPAGSVPDVLEYTLAPEFALEWAKDEPSWAETAAHHAMTLYALHQQSVSKGMHKPGPSVGRAMRGLISGSSFEPTHPIARRFAILGTSDSFDELIHHLRGAVQLLRGARLPLDYGLLTTQLVAWQHRGGPDRVRLVWGRDFHLSNPAKDAENQ